MSGYEELSRLGVQFRPIDVWPGTLARSRGRSPFSSKLSATLDLLARELRALDARRIVFQIAVGENEIRLDGFPKANAHADHPGIVLAFESKWGPLKYATDVYWTWQDNLRAIALAMESLRRVDRYGVSKRGEQYQGWRALPRSTDPADSIETPDQARRVLESWGGDVKRALFETHPDRGGDPDAFRRVVRARDVLRGIA